MHRNVRFLDHLAPQRGLRLDEGGGVGRAAAGGGEVHGGEARLHPRLMQHFVDCLVELGDDRRRRLGRRADRVPGARFEALDAELLEGRRVGQRGDALSGRLVKR